MYVDELVALLGYEVKGEEKLRRFTQSIDDTAKRLATFAAAAATAAAGAATLLGRSVIQTTAKFESFQATLETVEGSAEKARASLDWISDFAKKTPFEVEELTDAFVKLRAYGMDPTNGLMEDLGNASSAMGKSLTSAVEMIADASTGEFERLKEFGIRASQAGDQVTFSWTENGKTLTRTVKKNSEEITKFIQERFGARFSGAMLRQSKTWNGMMSNLSDSWTDFQRRIGEAGFFETVKNQLGRGLDYIAQLDADGTIDRIARALSDGLTWAVDQAVFAFSRLTRHFNFISGWVSANGDLWDKIKYGLMILGAYVFPKTAALLVLEDILSYLEGGDSVIGDLAKSLAELTGIDAGTLGNIFASIAGGGAALLFAWPIIAGVAGAIKSLAGALGLLGAKNVADGLKNLGEAAGDGKTPKGKGGGLGIAALAAGVWGAAAGGVWSLFDPGEGMKNAPRSKIGVDDMIRWMFGTDGSTPTASPYSGDAARARSDQQSMNFLSGYEQRMQNAQGNFAKMGADQSGAAVANTINDSSDKSVNVTINQTVQQATDAPAAAASATANAAAGAASRSLPPPRFVPGGV